MTPTPWRASPILGVPNVRASAEYYRDVLGFELDPVDGIFAPIPGQSQGVYGIVKRQGVWIHFQIRREPAPVRQQSPLERDVYLYITDLDKLHVELTGRGAKILNPPAMAPHGIREMVVEDDNGYRLAFGELL